MVPMPVGLWRSVTVVVVVVVVMVMINAVSAEHWAVIVAGSTGYSNYRHQSDACHAYHVVRRHGIPAENVVLMMYDDVAWHESNPYPGQLFNRPSSKRVSHVTEPSVDDVYKGCNIDFRGEDVTPETFVNVLTGNRSGALKHKKVLASDAGDRVFVNFVDHGSRGNVYFPHMKPLSAAKLKQAMQTMYDTHMYKELVVYMEACESGSMFSDRFLKRINAFVTTAANGFESSWATYCPPLDEVRGKSIGSCLGDMYSVNWMEDSDLTDLSGETLATQFHRVKNKTAKSHVKAFGSSKLSHEIVGNYQSTYDKSANDVDATSSKDTTATRSKDAAPNAEAWTHTSAVDARDVDLVVAFYRYLRAAAGNRRREWAAELTAAIEAREAADRVFETIRALYERQTKVPLVRVQEAEKIECHARVTRAFEVQCAFMGGLSSYSLQYAGTFLDLCESELTESAAVAVVRDACAATKRLGFVPTSGVGDINVVTLS